ncbi:MAG: protein kinase [Myxococcales bacterium]|nr:protein kinase [Myxococcales bacterium]
MTTTRTMALPSQVTQRYALVRPLAEGATSMVYLSMHASTQRLCVVKVMPSDPDGRWLQRYMRQAAAAQAIDDPHVLQVFDVGQAGDSAFVVSEYAEGRSTLDWVARHGPMPARMAVALVRDACMAVQTAHDSRIVHGRLSAAKLLIDGKGRCKVTGFGGEPDRDALSQAMLSDTRGLATTLYTLLTGYPPPPLPWGDVPEAQVIPPSLRMVLERPHTTALDLYRDLGEVAWMLPAAPLQTPSILAEQPVVDLFTPTLSDRGHRPRPVSPTPLPSLGAVQAPQSSLDLSREDLTEGGRIRMLEAAAEPVAPRRFEWHTLAFPVVAAALVTVLLTASLATMVYARMSVLSEQHAEVQQYTYNEIRHQITPAIVQGLRQTKEVRPPFTSTPQVLALLEHLAAHDHGGRPHEVVATATRLQVALEHDLMREVLMRAQKERSSELEGAYWELEDANRKLVRALHRLQR